MGRRPCCDKIGLKKGAWTAEEDKKLINFILSNIDQCCWRAVPKRAGLLRCGKSCRLRWTNYLRPDLKRGLLSEYEERLIIDLHSQHGNKWSKIASHMPGRTDNEIKNLWHTHIKKKLSKMGIDPVTHKPLPFDPPTDDHQSRGEAEQIREEMHEQDEVQEIDGVPLLESTITNPDVHDLQAKEKIALMDNNNGFSIDEVPIIQPHEILVHNSDLPFSSSSATFFSTSSASSTTISMPTINSILDGLKFSPYFEDWHTDDHSKSYMENMSFPYDDDFTDWDSLLNDIDIDKIGQEIIHSPPDFTTAQE